MKQQPGHTSRNARLKLDGHPLRWASHQDRKGSGTIAAVTAILSGTVFALASARPEQVQTAKRE
jgi:hypothetical protein